MHPSAQEFETDSKDQQPPQQQKQNENNKQQISQRVQNTEN